MHNKKGALSEEVILFIPRIILLIISLFTIVILIKQFIITNVDVRDVEANVLLHRILYSKDGISYYDNNLNRLYPGIIDINKFKQISGNNPNFLDNEAINYGAENPIIAAKMNLKDIQEDKSQSNKAEISAYYNKERFDKWGPRVLSTVTGGAGSFKIFKTQRYVLVMEGETLSPKILEFQIIG